MLAIIILIISIVFHALAALFALRFIHTTGRRLAWSLIAAGLALVTLQRAIPFYDMFFELNYTNPTLTHALVSLITGLLLVAGVALIAPLLQTYKQHDQLRDVLGERSAIVQQLHEEVLRSLRQIHIAVEVGKPANLILSQVGAITHAIQAFMEDMKSGLLVGNNFGTALQSLIQDLTHDHPLPVQVEINPAAAKSLTKEQGTQLLHITREALNNSQQHAKAKKSRVSLHTKRNLVELEINDNGRGFEVDLVEAQGHGLGNMVARAKKIGARLKIHSRPKQGTHIHIEVPMNGVHTHT